MGDRETLSKEILADLAALGRTTARNIAPLSTFAASGTRLDRPRRNLAVVAAVAATLVLAVVAGAFYPMTRDRPAGVHVSLVINGVASSEETLAPLMREFEEALGANAVPVQVTQGVDVVELGAVLAVAQAREASLELDSLVARLGEQGIAAHVTRHALVERLSGPWLRSTRSVVVRLELKNRKTEELTRDLRGRLAALGRTDLDIVPLLDGRDHASVELRVHSADFPFGLLVAGVVPPVPSAGLREQPLDPATLRITTEKSEGSIALIFEDGNQRHLLEFRSGYVTSDAQLLRLVQSHLDEEGVAVAIDLVDGEWVVRPR